MPGIAAASAWALATPVRETAKGAASINVLPPRFIEASPTPLDEAMESDIVVTRNYVPAMTATRTRTRTRTSPTDALRADAEALHAAMTHLVRLYQFRDRDKICCHDVSVTQCNALEILVERGPSRSQALSAALMLDKSTTTRVVDALVKKGYVERRADPEDARAVALTVTRTGRSLYQRINDELVNQQIEILRDLDPEVRAGATRIVSRLARVAQQRFLGDTTAAHCGLADK